MILTRSLRRGTPYISRNFEDGREIPDPSKADETRIDGISSSSLERGSSFLHERTLFTLPTLSPRLGRRLVKCEPCKLAFNGTRRTDPATSPLLSPPPPPLLSLRATTGARHCYRSFSRSRRGLVTPARRIAPILDLRPFGARARARARGGRQEEGKSNARGSIAHERSKPSERRERKPEKRSNNRAGMYINQLP
jgi:hypothetical protein